MKILINAGNIHGGGAVAIACSFISYLSYNNFKEKIGILVSTEVLRNLESMGIELSLFEAVIHADFNGLRALIEARKINFKEYSIVFTIFGPCYFKIPKNTKHIIGFAHPWIIYPKNLASTQLNFFKRIITRFTNYIRTFFFNADIIIVELEHVQKGLNGISNLKKIPVRIINSQVDPVYMNRNKWKNLQIEDRGNLKLGIISRNYPHKNIKILPEVKTLLHNKYNIKVDFYVTFSESEFNKMDKIFRDSIINVGELNLNQCPSFYNKMDGIIFPSLLECFSAVPIEAMYMKRPIFASDLHFIHDCCNDNAIYVEPLNPSDIAFKIMKYFNEPEALRSEKIERAFQYVSRYTNLNARGDAYMKCIKDLMIGKVET